MEDLTKIQAELAEFFCEDPKSFRLEECYKAFLQFNNNLGQSKLYLMSKKVNPKLHKHSES